jgi:chromosome segregation ATPase
VVGMENAIQQEKEEFNNKLKPRLEQAFEEEQLKVEQLSRKIQREQDRFEMEKASLEQRIAAEKKRLDVVQYQLSQERTENQQVLKDLQFEQTLIEDQRAEDRERMSQRYAALRAAITARIEAEKREGRKDEKELTQKYETTLKDTRGVIEDLQNQVQSRLESNFNLQKMVNDMKAQVQQVYTDKQEAEVRYQRLILDRKIEIKGLETNVQELKETITERDQEIEQVEHSYRAIAKASLKLTGKRLNKLNPVRLLRRGKNKSR